MSHETEHPKPVFGCQSCIDRANVGAIDTIEHSGWKVWEVHVERRSDAVFKVLAPTKERAQEDGEELASEALTGLYPDDDAWVMEFKGEVDPDEEVWTGGAEGDWKPARELGLGRAAS